MIEDKIAQWGSPNCAPAVRGIRESKQAGNQRGPSKSQDQENFGFQPARRRKSGKGDKADLRELARKLGLGKTLPESKR
jgi:hypothetical protein